MPFSMLQYSLKMFKARWSGNFCNQKLTFRISQKDYGNHCMRFYRISVTTSLLLTSPHVGEHLTFALC